VQNEPNITRPGTSLQRRKTSMDIQNAEFFFSLVDTPDSAEVFPRKLRCNNAYKSMFSLRGFRTMTATSVAMTTRTCVAV